VQARNPLYINPAIPATIFMPLGFDDHPYNINPFNLPFDHAFFESYSGPWVGRDVPVVTDDEQSVEI
jgi:hypothetical protein